jgi:hypothetical protein
MKMNMQYYAIWGRTSVVTANVWKRIGIRYPVVHAVIVLRVTERGIHTLYREQSVPIFKIEDNWKIKRIRILEN